MSAFVVSEPVRARMNRLYRGLRGASDGWFRHEGAPGWGVPAWCVKAYVRARFEGADPAAALARAHYGAGPEGLGEGGRRHVAAMAARLAEIERGLGSRAA